MATGRVPTTANSPLTAKGDLFGYSTTQARVAVGNDGETLVADSATSTGLRYQGNFAAGKNAIINGAFNVWQRGTSFALTVSTTYIADRWRAYRDGTGATLTASQQTFTPGTAPVAGYEGTYFLRFAQTVAGTGGSYNVFTQPIEDVRVFAGQTVTLSFWAKADASRSLGTNVIQNFGTGGSSAVYTSGTTASLTTSWQRFTTTVANPSIAGKTIGTNSLLDIRLDMPVNTTFTIDIWGVQLEASNTATAFQTATGTLQGELAACQRYYWRQTVSTNQPLAPTGGCATAAIADSALYFPVTMRLNPSSIEVSNVGFYNWGNGSIYESGTITSAAATLYAINLRYTHGSNVFTTGQSGALIGRAASSYIGINAEL